DRWPVPLLERAERDGLPAPAADRRVLPGGPGRRARAARRARRRGGSAGARRGRRGEVRLMFCPFCRHPDSRVIDSRTSDDGLSIRRRRQCPECGGRFTTTETATLMVIKRNGVVEAFSRDKVASGVRKAAQGRPVEESQLAE